MNLISKMLDILYPRSGSCLYCGEGYYSSEIYGLCESCLQKINYIERCCSRCGRNLAGNEEDLCSQCRNKEYHFESARSIAVYSGLFRQLILNLKYECFLEMTAPLSELLYSYFKYYFKDRVFDYIIPVPLHSERLQERGFNQAELLAVELSLRTGLPLLTEAVKRKKNNPPLYKYSAEERINYIKGCFYLEESKKQLLENSSILLLDDIFTTGTTVNELSYLLKKEGRVRRVDVYTAASASYEKV